MSNAARLNLPAGPPLASSRPALILVAVKGETVPRTFQCWRCGKSETTADGKSVRQISTRYPHPHGYSCAECYYGDNLHKLHAGPHYNPDGTLTEAARQDYVEARREAA